MPEGAPQGGPQASVRGLQTRPDCEEGDRVKGNEGISETKHVSGLLQRQAQRHFELPEQARRL